MSRFIDISGKTFNKITVISRANPRYGKTYWNCVCHCGKHFEARGVRLKNGSTTSCGCHKTTHGMSNTPTYHSWENMVQRATNPNKSFDYYIGRGIGICDSWMDFNVFLSDMGVRPEGKTIDRIDNNSGYSKDNCRWATPFEQMNNRRDTIFITYLGVKQSVGYWSKESGISISAIRSRLNLGWTAEKILTTPIREKPL